MLLISNNSLLVDGALCPSPALYAVPPGPCLSHAVIPPFLVLRSTVDVKAATRLLSSSRMRSISLRSKTTPEELPLPLPPPRLPRHLQLPPPPRHRRRLLLPPPPRRHPFQRAPPVPVLR